MTVENILIIELGNDSIGIAQQNFSQAFNNGDSFEYVSSINDDASTIPKTIQLNILGQNAAGQSIINFLAIQFTNNCSFYPVLDEGSSLGWTVIVSAKYPIYSSTRPFVSHQVVLDYRRSWETLPKVYVQHSTA